MKADNYREAVLLELKALLSSILEKRIADMAVLRRVDELRHGIMHGGDPVFFPIRATVSDLDDIPDEALVSLFSEKFLNEQRQKKHGVLTRCCDQYPSSSQRTAVVSLDESRQRQPTYRQLNVDLVGSSRRLRYWSRGAADDHRSKR